MHLKADNLYGLTDNPYSGQLYIRREDTCIRARGSFLSIEFTILHMKGVLC